MRTLVAVTLAGFAGCFSELPSPPSGDIEDTTAAATSSGPGSSSSTSSGATATDGPPIDQDMSSGSSGGPTAEGLFACTPLACEPWDCTQGCDMTDPAAVCVLKALRDRIGGSVEVASCKEGACATHRLQIRGAGTDDVSHQWHDDADPPKHSNTWQCTANAPEFFQACLTNFTPECGDPDAWVSQCVQTSPSC